MECFRNIPIKISQHFNFLYKSRKNPPWTRGVRFLSKAPKPLKTVLTTQHLRRAIKHRRGCAKPAASVTCNNNISPLHQSGPSPVVNRGKPTFAAALSKWVKHGGLISAGIFEASRFQNAEPVRKTRSGNAAARWAIGIFVGPFRKAAAACAFVVRRADVARPWFSLWSCCFL